MHAVTINFIVGCLVTLIGCGLTGPVCKLLGASGNYFELAKDYVFWWALFAIANSVSLNLQSFCRNDGNPGLVAVTNVVITVMNIFLDRLFVFPMQKGVAGAAIATGISQVIGLCIILTHFIFKKGELRIRKYKPQGKLYRKIVLRGLPEAIAQFSTPVTTFCMNQTLMAATLVLTHSPLFPICRPLRCLYSSAPRKVCNPCSVRRMAQSKIKTLNIIIVRDR